ncbi:Uncharacterised protein [Streptococcus pneumoniae]|nr:Uncharacterised protein [Streptococcus pneumoniae]
MSIISMVLVIIVKKSPATARGIATAWATPIPVLVKSPPRTMIMAAATEASAASGAIAAPIFDQPRAII